MHLKCMYNVFYLRFKWEVRALGMRDTLKHGTITFSGFWARHVKTRNDNVLRILIFSQKLPFSVGKNNVSKTNLGSTIHYTYTSYNKYSRLCMVSEELRLNEISLFRYCDVYRVRNLLNRIHTRGIFASMSQITGSLFYYTEIQYSLYKMFAFSKNDWNFLYILWRITCEDPP